MATAIFYASNTGNTEAASDIIAKSLEINDVFDLSNSIEKLNDYDKIIVGVSTWGEGELPDELDDVWEEFCQIDFSGKVVALFGLGDQDTYSDNYCDAMGIVYEQVTKSGAKVVGFTSSSQYEHEESKAQINDEFVGLALDEDNQSELTNERVSNWCKQIKGEII